MRHADIHSLVQSALYHSENTTEQEPLAMMADAGLPGVGYALGASIQRPYVESAVEVPLACVKLPTVTFLEVAQHHALDLEREMGNSLGRLLSTGIIDQASADRCLSFF